MSPSVVHAHLQRFDALEGKAGLHGHFHDLAAFAQKLHGLFVAVPGQRLLLEGVLPHLAAFGILERGSALRA